MKHNEVLYQRLSYIGYYMPLGYDLKQSYYDNYKISI